MSPAINWRTACFLPLAIIMTGCANHAPVTIEYHGSQLEASYNKWIKPPPWSPAKPRPRLWNPKDIIVHQFTESPCEGALGCARSTPNACVIWLNSPGYEVLHHELMHCYGYCHAESEINYPTRWYACETEPTLSTK